MTVMSIEIANELENVENIVQPQTDACRFSEIKSTIAARHFGRHTQSKLTDSRQTIVKFTTHR